MKLLMFEHCFPGRVRDYVEAMMSRIGFAPLPAI